MTKLKLLAVTIYALYAFGCQSNQQKYNIKWQDSFQKHLPEDIQYKLVNRYEQNQKEFFVSLK